MAQVQSNILTVNSKGGLVGGTPFSPAQNALQSKINPPTLQPLKSGISLGGNNFSIGGTSTPATYQAPQQVHSSLVQNLASTGGTHTTTDSLGNTSSVKIPTPQNNQYGNSNPTDLTNKNSSFQTQGLTGYNNTQSTAPTSQNNATDSSGNPVQVGNPSLNPQFNYGNSDITSTPNKGVTYPGLINQLLSAGGKATSQQGAIADQIAQLRNNLQTDTGVIQGQPSELNFQTGRINALQNQEASKEANLQGQLQAQIAANQQNIGAIGSALTAAQPQLAGFNQQSFNPLTGQFGSGGQTGNTALSQLPQQAQTAIQSYAKQIKNGSMTRADAESRLSAYGVAGTNALNEVLGTDFNTNASNASAGTTAIGQQIKTAADSTNKALDTLGTSFSSLSGLQTGGIPATNSIANWIASNLGDKALTQYKTNLADARSQLIGVLNSSGGTPTGNEATANEYLPDNMTKAQFDQNVGTAQNPGIVRQLISQKVQSFTQSGQQNNQSTSNNLFNW